MAAQRSLFDKQPPEPAPPRAYFTRGHARADEAQAGEQRAQQQNEILLGVFRMRPAERLTPWDVFTILSGRFPVTSVRRGLTTMSAPGGPLRHHPEDRRPSGPYNALSSVWSLA